MTRAPDPGKRQATNAASPPLLSAEAIIVGLAAALTPVAFWRGAYDSFGSVKLLVLALAALGLLGVALWRRTAGERVDVPRDVPTLALGAFVLAGVVVTLLSGSPAASIFGEYTRSAGLAGYVACAILFVATARLRPGRQAEAVAAALLAGSAVVTLYGLVQVADLDPYQWVDEGLNATISTLGQPNFVSGFLGACLPLAVGAAALSTVPRAARILAGVLAVGMAALILETGSFQGLVAAAIGCLVLVIAVLADRVTRRQGWGVAIGAAALALLLLAVPAVRSELDEQLEAGFDERLLLWDAGTTMVADRPIVGDGFGAFARYFTEVRPAEHAQFGFLPADSPHNVPLAMAVGGGALLLVPYAIFVGAIGWTLVRGLRRRSGWRRTLLGAVGGAWVAYQVQSLVTIETPALMVLHFVTAGLVVALARAEPSGDATAPPVKGGRTHRRSTSLTGRDLALRVAGVLVLLLGVWQLSRPFRGDLAAAAGRDAEARGDVVGATSHYESATGRASWVANFWGLRASTLQQEGRLAEALEAGERAAIRAPGNVIYALSTAQLAEQVSQQQTAERWYRFALEHDPLNVQVVQAAASFFASIDDADQAVAIAQTFVEQRPDLAQGWVVLGRAQLQAGGPGEAERSARRAIAIDPANGEAQALLTDARSA